MNKDSIRKYMIGKRKQLDSEEVSIKSKKIIENLYSLENYKDANSVMTYVSFNNEVDTINLIKDALCEGKTVSVPLCITNTHNLKASQIKSLEDLQIGTFGILEPKKPIIIDPNTLEIIIVPALAFDHSLQRIGYGAGYYDRFLGKATGAIKIGLAFEFQVWNFLPNNEYDIPMDYIITENEIRASIL